ncbi:hypothetical protein [Flavonifractor hominis]|uniref:Uncharacterized protein n=1 Tax=Flavonifractor hominis TaxID=3133178 RepID=A0ABV1EN93_9FIRM
MITVYTAPYRLTSAQLCTEDGVVYQTYGIAHESGLGIVDVGCNKALVSAMVEFFNHACTPPQQLKRIVINLLP